MHHRLTTWLPYILAGALLLELAVAIDTHSRWSWTAVAILAGALLFLRYADT